MDVLEALAASCTQLAAGWTPRAAANVACDALVASLLLVLHGATLMSQVGLLGARVAGQRGPGAAQCIAQPVLLPLPMSPQPIHSHPHPHPPLQAMVFGVAMNSKKNTLVALLIAANFTEIKGGWCGWWCVCGHVWHGRATCRQRRLPDPRPALPCARHGAQAL